MQTVQFLPTKNISKTIFSLQTRQSLRYFHSIFSVGDAKSALANPNQIVLTERIAVKYFGSVEAAIGKQLLFEGTIPLEVSAVIADYPRSVDASN